ncbi:unnamed protein product [Rotaria sp. Silwood1]|nr:unnamed protein product [Rotaria sp. Silwood1]
MRSTFIVLSLFLLAVVVFSQPRFGDRTDGRGRDSNHGNDHRGNDHHGNDHRGNDHHGNDHRGNDHHGNDHRGNDHHGDGQRPGFPRRPGSV